MSLFRSKAEQKLIDKGLDPARLPPGQYLTEKWPVLHAGTVPQTDLATWDFKVFGEVDEPTTLSYDELQALPTTEITTDIHCVTRWSRFGMSFQGVRWRELAKLVRPKPSAHFVLAHGEQGFTANVPLAALEDDNSLIAWAADGEPLEPDHGWPLRLVVPSRTSGRAPSGCAASNFSLQTNLGSGSATATTTRPTTGRNSGTASELAAADAPSRSPVRGRGWRRQERPIPHANHLPLIPLAKRPSPGPFCFQRTLRKRRRPAYAGLR